MDGRSRLASESAGTGDFGTDEEKEKIRRVLLMEANINAAAMAMTRIHTALNWAMAAELWRIAVGAVLDTKNTGPVRAHSDGYLAAMTDAMAAALDVSDDAKQAREEGAMYGANRVYRRLDQMGKAWREKWPPTAESSSGRRRARLGKDGAP